MVIKCQIKGDCYSKKVHVGGEGEGGGERSTVAHLGRLIRIGGNAYT